MPLLLAVDNQTLWMDPDTRNERDDICFLNQRVRLHNLVLGFQFFPSIIFLRHIISEVFGTNRRLPWKEFVGLCLLLFHFGNKVFIKSRLNKILKDEAVKVLYSICQQIWKTPQWS